MHADRAIAVVAGRQHGVVSRGQLGDLGLSRSAIAHRLHRGRLHRLHRGVYLVGHVAPPPLALETAALLACGDGALLSHESAAHLWRLGPAPDSPHVTLTKANAGPRPQLHVHRSPVPRDQRTRLHGLPLTTPARTLLDLAATRPARELERALAEAQARNLVRTHDLLSLVERSPTRAGAAALERLLEQGPRLTRSEAERRMLSLIDRAHLPRPEANVRLEGFELDLLWRAQRLVVEVDGFAFHGSRTAFERDRRRDAALVAAGYRVLRVTWRRLVDEPEAVVADLARALGP